MNIEKFVNSIYLGDRACKGIYINGWEETISIEVDSISRIRDPSGNWNYYTDEDIEDGLIIFTEAKAIHFAPSGPIPNDLINDFRILDRKGDVYIFRFSIASINDKWSFQEILVDIEAKSLYIENPNNPNIKITL